MPETLIPPFAAQGSSAQEEKALHPPLIQKILEAVAVLSTGLGGGLRGNPLAGAQLAQSFQGNRLGAVQNAIAGRLLGQGIQLGQIPQTRPGITGFDAPGSAGIAAPQIGETPNPAYQDLINKILQGAEQYARLGGNVDVLTSVLTKAGVMQSPPERIALERERGLNKRFEASERLKRDILKFRQDVAKANEPLVKAKTSYYNAKQREASRKAAGDDVKNLTRQQAINLLMKIQDKLAKARLLYPYEVEQAEDMGLPIPSEPTEESVSELTSEALAEIREIANRTAGGTTGVITGAPPLPTVARGIDWNKIGSALTPKK